MEEAAPAEVPPAEQPQQSGPQQEPVNFNPQRRVTIGGTVDRRGSLASVSEEMFQRRPSMDGTDSLFGRRESMDTAAFDAAILDLSRRRSSMMHGSDASFHAPQSPLYSYPTTQMVAGAMGIPSMPPPFPPSSQSNVAVSTIAARQKQLQQQQRELEQCQKVLEMQRQQLLSNMQGGGVSVDRMGPGMYNGMMGTMPSRHSSFGLGSSMHSQTSHGSVSQSSSRSQNWWICQVCNAKAFSSHEEAMAHEATCQESRRGVSAVDQLGASTHSIMSNSLHNAQLLNDMSQRSAFSLGMDSSHHSGYSDLQSATRQEAARMSNGPFARLTEPMPLAMASDKDWLTPLHCFVRRHCVEIFTATDNDVATPSKGKRKPIQVGQIGIRCPHCHAFESTSNNKSRERGSVYYPTTISSIYNATMNLLQRHLHSCPAVPADIMRRYETLKADDARSGTSKRYWVESALSLGLVDTPSGIRYSALRPPPPPLNPQQQQQQEIQSQSNGFYNAKKSGAQSESQEEDKNKGSSQSAPEDMDSSASDPLVTPEDKPYSTTFSYHLLLQMQRCNFTEADRLGKRKGLPPGFPGLACRHCFGGYGSGRFFPSSIKTLSDTSKTLNVLHNHMMRCRKCPTEIRDSLESLRKSHDDERSKMKFGSQKAFFARIWKRLHGDNQPSSFPRARSAGPAFGEPVSKRQKI